MAIVIFVLSFSICVPGTNPKWTRQPQSDQYLQENKDLDLLWEFDGALPTKPTLELDISHTEERIATNIIFERVTHPVSFNVDQHGNRFSRRAQIQYTFTTIRLFISEMGKDDAGLYTIRLQSSDDSFSLVDTLNVHVMLEYKWIQLPDQTPITEGEDMKFKADFTDPSKEDPAIAIILTLSYFNIYRDTEYLLSETIWSNVSSITYQGTSRTQFGQRTKVEYSPGHLILSLANCSRSDTGELEILFSFRTMNDSEVMLDVQLYTAIKLIVDPLCKCPPHECHNDVIVKQQGLVILILKLAVIVLVIALVIVLYCFGIMRIRNISLAHN